MYMDVVVFAGVATVLLMVAFFAGVGFFIMRDHKAHGEKQVAVKEEAKEEAV